MIYVHKDGTGYTAFPVPEDLTGFLVVGGADEQRIRAGDRYRLINAGEAVEFLTQEEIDAEDAAKALAQERAAMVVSRFQARAALFQNNLLNSAAAVIAQGDAFAQLAWEDAQEFRRTSPLVASIGGALNLTEEQLDDLFRLAKTIEA